MNEQISNYIRGKVIHILIVGSVSYIVFLIMGLNYALLLGVLVGFSVLIPSIGAFSVTLPVLFVALFQWGFSPVITSYSIHYTKLYEKTVDTVPWGVLCSR